MLSLNYFFLIFSPILAPLLENAIFKCKKMQFPQQKKRGYFKIEVGKEGHKETLNPTHQCSPLFQNNSGCPCKIQRPHSFL